MNCNKTVKEIYKFKLNFEYDEKIKSILKKYFIYL